MFRVIFSFFKCINKYSKYKKSAQSYNFASLFYLNISKKRRLSHLSLWARAIWSEIILPFRKPQICDHKPVVSSEGRGKIMPEKRSVQKPHLTLLGHYAYTEPAINDML